MLMNVHRRWLPRVILAALAVLFVLLAAQPFLHRQVVRIAEQLTGTRLRPERLISSLASGQVLMTNIRGVDPDQPDRQLFVADEMALQLDRKSLVHGHVVVRRGHVNGLRLSTPAIPPDACGRVVPSEDSQRSLSRWLRLLEQSPNVADVETGQLAQLSRQLCDARPQHVSDVARRASVVARQVQQLQDSLTSVGANPLRNRTQYQQAVEEIDGLHREIFRVRRELDQCQQQLQMDRVAVDDARQHDLRVFSTAPVAVQVTPQQITDYFLEAEVQQRVQSALTWIRWGRQFFPSLYADRPNARQRGRDIRFLGAGTLGDVLIESLVVRGECEGAFAPLRLEGTVTGLGSRPDLRDQPAEIVLQALGTSQTVIRAHAGVRDGEPIDQIVVSGPRWKVPETLWGQSQLVGIIASEGDCQFWLSLQHHQGQVTGELVVKRANMTLSPRLSATQRGDMAGAVLTAAMRNIRTVEMTARLSGSWEHPTLNVRSNLGAELAANVEQQVTERQTACCEEALAHRHREVLAQLELVENDLTRRHDELVQLLDTGAGQIDRLRATVAERVEQTDAMLEPDSPLRETLRR